MNKLCSVIEQKNLDGCISFLERVSYGILERKLSTRGRETYLLDTISIRDNPNSRETFLLTLFYIIYYKHYFFFFICRIIMCSKIEKKILDKMESR